MIRHHERHLVQRIGWMRASVLGANDGIVSTASLMVGVAAANSSQSQILLTGIAGLVAGAMSMAAGEYVSVSSQSDTENADRARETRELEEEPESEVVRLRRRGSEEDGSDRHSESGQRARCGARVRGRIPAIHLGSPLSGSDWLPSPSVASDATCRALFGRFL